MKYFVIVLVFSFSFGQTNKFVDFTNINANIDIDFKEKQIIGFETMIFKMSKMCDTIIIDAKNMNFTDLKINGRVVKFKNNAIHLLLFEGFKKGKNILTFSFVAKPKQCVYFTGNVPDFQIYTQGQGKFTSNWLPSFDDFNEKIIFGLTIRFDKQYTVLSNGILTNSTTSNDLKTWQYQMRKPMSSYLVMFSIGKFDKKIETSKSGITLENYLLKDDSSKFLSTYRYNKQIFDFMESEIEVAYPWNIYRQVPVKDFLYAGMENTSTTVFSQDFVVDDIGFTDKNYINVNAHELAHQWFGNLITAKTGKHHWLQEGFATYYALLAEKNIFGDDHFNWKMYEMAERIQLASKTDTIPILNEKASTISFYQKGAWAIHVMRSKIGDQNFHKIIKNYFQKHQFQNVETDDFLRQVSKYSNFDVDDFQAKWLVNSNFDIAEVLDILKKNQTMQQYFEIVALVKKPFAEKRIKFGQLVKSNASTNIKQEIVAQLQKVSFLEKKTILQELMSQNDWHVRQSIASSLSDFPDEFKAEFETFLQDKSYITKEIALNVLWKKYPDERIPLLEKTKDWFGFYDHNLRILWLNLALRTKDFVTQDKSILYDELLRFSSNEFETTTRQNAINTVLFLDKNDQNVLVNIINGLSSQRWQMVRFCKEKIRMLLKNKYHRDFFEKLVMNLPGAEKTQLNLLLKE